MYEIPHRKGKNKLPRIITAIALLLVALLVAAVVLVRHQYYEGLKPVSDSQKNQLFTIKLGATVGEISTDLKKDGLIKESWAFEWYVRNNNLRDKVQAGSYYLNPSQGTPEITSIITKGRTATDLVTILPGKRLDQIRQALVNAGFSPGEVEAALDPSLYAGHPALVDKPVNASLEGYLYPESFQKSPETKPQVVIKASLDEMQKYLTPEIRQGFVKQGLTVHQGVILASIVEQEVGNEADRPKVAQVFLKRLKTGMQLGSDVTAFYGAIINDKKPSVLYDSPYNTRMHAGFPPGPISNVSRSSLNAVANPANTDFLFFVAGDDGVTYFSKTIEEHESLTKQHCQRLCSL